MKRFVLATCAALCVAFSALAAGELVATGADCRTYHVGSIGGGAFSAVYLGNNRTIAPWRISVTNAVKRTTSTETVFVATNYVVAATVSYTNLVPVVTELERTLTNKVYATVGDASVYTNLGYSVATNTYVTTDTRTGLSVSNAVVTASLTGSRLSLDGLPAPWTVVSTNGYNSTVTNVGTVAAGGKITLKNAAGDSWDVNVSSGSGSLSATVDLSKLVFAGELTATSTDAEKADVRIVYMTFNP